MIEQTELTEIKTQVSSVQEAANALKVENQEDMNRATDALHNVSKAEKYVVEKKEAITRPLMKSLSAIRDLFKPLETNLADAKKIIKGKMLAWQIEEDDRITKEKERIAKRVEKGTMRPDTAAGKMEAVGEAPVKSTGEVGKSSIRTVKKVRVMDETMIPREYLLVNMTAITEAVIKKGIDVPGTETYEEKMIVGR